MKTQSKIWASIGASLAVSGVIAFFVFSSIQGIGNDLARGRNYSAVIQKAFALDVLVATFGRQSGQRHIEQFGQVRASLTKLLDGLKSSDFREESLLRQIRRNNRELGPLLDQFLVLRTEPNDAQSEFIKILTGQLWTKVRFISDDTNRLMDISQSRIIAAQEKAGTLVILLILILALTNGGIYFISGRSIVRAQEALRQSEEKFRVTLGSIGDAVVATDDSGRVAFLNPVAAELTGWPSEEAAGQPTQSVFQVINEQTRQPVENIVEHVLREGAIVSLANHTVLIARDGREIPIEDSAAPIKDDAGNISGVVLVFHDVTEKRRAQEQVIQSQKTFSELVERSPFGTYVVDSDFRIAMMNTASQDGAFCNVRPVIGRDFSVAMRILWPEPVAAKIIGDFRHTLETGETFYSPRFTNPRQDVATVESYEWELHRMVLPDGRYGVICYYYDSTNLREAEAALRMNQERLALAASGTGTGIFEWDIANGKILWTQQHDAIFGYQSQVSTTTTTTTTTYDYKHWSDRVHAEDLPRVEEATRRCMKERKPFDVEYRIIWPDGSLHWVQAKGVFPYYDDQNQAEQMVGIVVDITESKRAEEERQRLLVEVQHERDRLSALVNGITDEIWFADAEKKVTLVNPAVRKEFGSGICDVKEVEKIAASLEVYRPDGTPRPVEEAPLLSALRGEIVKDLEEIIRTPATGQLRYRQVNAAPVRDLDGVIIGSVSVVRDISERKQAEKEREELLKNLEEKSSQLEAVLANMVEAVGIWNADGNLILLNEATLKLYGFETKEQMLKHLSEYADVIVRTLDGRDLPQEEWPPSRALRGESFSNWWLMQEVPSRGLKFVGSNSGAPIRDANGKIVLAVTAVHDVTELYNSGEALQQRTWELQRLTETLEERVRERTAELAELSSQMVSAQENERKRVSYDLHDNVWQTLTFIRLEIESLFNDAERMDRAPLRDKSKMLTKVIQDTVGIIRSMQGDLWPYVLDDIGILATLDWYCREFQKGHPDLTIERQGDLAEAEIPPPVKIVIYRILQETLSNVANHSRATRVLLGLSKKDRRLEFTVADNGLGFDLENIKVKRSPWGGLGLLNIKARTELSGGIFEVESGMGGGTTVKVSWSFQ